MREKILNDHPESCIVLATSGMMNGGPVMEYFKEWAENKKNTIAFVGYQAEGTLGKRIQKGWEEIPLNEGGSIVNIKMKMNVETCDGFSGHCDRRQLLNYINNMSPRPEKIIFGHGEESKCLDISSAVYKRYNVTTSVLNNLESIRFR
jgi:predicted metal-dependent RNase